MVNPLEHHSFRHLIEKREAVVSTSECTFTLRSYHYAYWNYFSGKQARRWWHLITMMDVTSFLKNQASERGLLLVDGIEVCVRCQTSEYVRKDEKLNCGVATCRCGSTYLGWE